MLLRPIALASALLAFSVGVPAHSQQQRLTAANELLVECQSQTEGCYDYLLGVWDGMIEAQAAARSRILCPAAGGVNAEQLRLVFLQYATGYPSLLGEPRADFVSAAFALAFGCRTPNT